MMESVPPGNVLVVNVAVPLLRGPVPNTVVPYLKVTISPLGMLPPAELTVAVKVTACPAFEGFTLEDTVVVVVFLTTCDTAPELAENAVSPG